MKIDAILFNCLKNLGMPANLSGYTYTKTAVQLVRQNPELIRAITKELYPMIAETHNTTPTRVERAIRHAVEVTWWQGNIDFQKELFGYTISADKGKPTNSEFIATIVEYINLQKDEWGNAKNS